MVNEERVINLSRMAMYDKQEGKEERQSGQFYRKDYVAKEMIKSVFSGTISYLLLVVLVVLSDADHFLAKLNTINLLQTGGLFVLLYVAFLSLYLFITRLVYVSRYRKGRAKMKEYQTRIKHVNKMYEREAKLKA